MINLIPLSYLNEACFLSLNVNEKKYNMVLKLSQRDLKNLLGPEFYTEIETEHEAGTLSVDNLALYDPYLMDYLAWQTYLYYLGFANADETPTGTREFVDDNSTVVSDIKMYSREKNVKSQVTIYKNSIINFLNEAQLNDSTKYPLWTNCYKEEMSFGISAVSKCSDALIKVNKAISSNE